MDVVKIIEENSLTVRCLPKVVVSHWTYREGDEERIKKPYRNSKGDVQTNIKRSIVTKRYDLEYFKNTPQSSLGKPDSPEKRLAYFLKHHPSGERKFLREERAVINGGWWYVKPAPHTNSSVHFDQREGTFLAPTLEEALQKYLDSKTKKPW